MLERKVFMGNFYLAMGVALILSLPAVINAQPIAVDPKLLQQLQETIQKQQDQLRKQDQQLQAQSEMLKSLQKQINDMKQPPALQPTVAAAVPQTAPPAAITSDNDKIKLTLSGQVNRAVNITTMATARTFTLLTMTSVTAGSALSARQKCPMTLLWAPGSRLQ